MIYTAPLYTKDFRCIADKCRDSCCIGWEIRVDERTKRKYRRLRGALGEAIRQSLTEDGCFRLCEGEKCAHLLESGLCRIISEAGDEALCDICREHPRFYNVLSEDECEWGIGLACESAAEIILSAKEPFSVASSKREGRESEADAAMIPHLKAERSAIGEIVFSKKMTMEQKLFMIEKRASSFQGFLDFSDLSEQKFTFAEEDSNDTRFLTKERFEKYKAVLLSLEPMNEFFPKRCESMKMPTSLDESSEIFERLLYYFIYRYFITAAEDGDAQGKVGLAIFSTLMIYALCESEERKTLEEIAEAAKDFSKEVEYSEDNRDTVMDAFSAFG